MTEDYQRCQKILQAIEANNEISQDDASFMQVFLINIQQKIASKPNLKLQITEDLSPKSTEIHLEDVSDLNNNNNKENSHSKLSNADSKQINDDDSEHMNYALYNILITLPSIFFCFEDFFTTCVLSKTHKWYFLTIYLIFIFIFHGVIVFGIFYYKDKKRRKSLLGALFSAATVAGKIFGEILVIICVKNDKKDDSNEIIQSLYKCLTALVIYFIITFPIYLYQTNCCQNKKNVEIYH